MDKKYKFEEKLPLHHMTLLEALELVQTDTLLMCNDCYNNAKEAKTQQDKKVIVTKENGYHHIIGISFNK